MLKQCTVELVQGTILLKYTLMLVQGTIVLTCCTVVLIQGAILQIQCTYDKSYRASKISQVLIIITSSKTVIIMFTEKRNISARDLGVGDREGWLLHRCRSGGAGAVWLRAWFVLKGTIFYGFKTPQSAKADTMISLPGFTASLADEVKSRRYAFKVYHTGKNEK